MKFFISNNKVNGIILMTIGLIFGLFFGFYFDVFKWIITVIIAIILLLVGISNLTYYIESIPYKKERMGLVLCKAILFIIIGASLLILPWVSYYVHLAISIAIGLYLIISCLISLKYTDNKKKQLMHDLYKYLAGAFIIVFGIGEFSRWILVGLCILVFLFGLYLFILSVNINHPIAPKTQSKKKSKKVQEEILDPEYEVDE